MLWPFPCLHLRNVRVRGADHLLRPTQPCKGRSPKGNRSPCVSKALVLPAAPCPPRQLSVVGGTVGMLWSPRLGPDCYFSGGTVWTESEAGEARPFCVVAIGEADCIHWPIVLPRVSFLSGDACGLAEVHEMKNEGFQVPKDNSQSGDLGDSL